MKLDEAVWQLDYLQSFHRDTSTGWVIDPIYIPPTLNTPIVRVSCLSKTARSSWRVAGELVQIIGSDRSPDFEGESISMPLNVLKLVRFPEIVTDYSLKFLPKPWIESFDLKVESLLSV
jgi:hypothetical protein